jgi:hypothetical protein
LTATPTVDDVIASMSEALAVGALWNPEMGVPERYDGQNTILKWRDDLVQALAALRSSQERLTDEHRRLREALARVRSAMENHNEYAHGEPGVVADDECGFDFAGSLATIDAALSADPQES